MGCAQKSKAEDPSHGAQETKAEEPSRLSEFDIGISSSLGFVKGMIALFQLYSVISYINTEKYEKKRINDYAAFQLTLIPYGLMSVVNILCGLVTPTYSAVYMVNSTIMEEARARGWTFDGAVGKLCENIEKEEKGGYFGFLATFEEDSGVGYNKDGETKAPLEVNTDQIGEVETNPSAKTTTSGINEVELNTESKGIKISCGIFKPRRGDTPFHEVWRDAWRDAWRILRDAFHELPLSRSLLLQDQDPGQEYLRSLFDWSEGVALDRPTKIVIPPIGNPAYREGSWWRLPMLWLSDSIVLVSLVLPHLITWKLTKFKAPTGGNLYGGVFMAWLVLGQLSPVPARITWGFIQSRQLRKWERASWYAFIFSFIGLWSIPAIWGFILVGKEMYFHPENDAPRG